MTLEETQDNKDILILLLIQERDKQIESLETGLRITSKKLAYEVQELKDRVKKLEAKLL